MPTTEDDLKLLGSEKIRKIARHGSLTRIRKIVLEMISMEGADAEKLTEWADRLNWSVLIFWEILTTTAFFEIMLKGVPHYT